jgi:hypothetical protein
MFTPVNQTNVSKFAYAKEKIKLPFPTVANSSFRLSILINPTVLHRGQDHDFAHGFSNFNVHITLLTCGSFNSVGTKNNISLLSYII